MSCLREQVNKGISDANNLLGTQCNMQRRVNSLQHATQGSVTYRMQVCLYKRPVLLAAWSAKLTINISLASGVRALIRLAV